MSDPTIRVEARFKNARLYNAIVERSVPLSETAQRIGVHAAGPIKAFCDLHGLRPTAVYELLNIKSSPVTRRKGYKPLCVQLASLLEQTVEWLFPLDIYNIPWPTLVGEADHTTMLSLFAARSEMVLPPTQESLVMQRELRCSIDAALSLLTPQEAMVLRKRNGLNGESEATIIDIAVQLGLSRGRVNQIEAKALRKLRHPSRSCLLSGHRPVDNRQVIHEDKDYEELGRAFEVRFDCRYPPTCGSDEAIIAERRESLYGHDAASVEESVRSRWNVVRVKGIAEIIGGV